MTEPLIELRGVTVSFPGVEALQDASIRFFPGEVHALMGQNGAGKSTVVKVLSGVTGPVSGEVLLDGQSASLGSPAASRDLGIATVFQDIELGPRLSVAENIMLGNEPRGRFGIDWKTLRAAASEQLARLGLGDLDPRTRLDALAPPVQQLVAVARAMVGDPRVVLLDEPTSSLEPGDVNRLFKVVRQLRDSGVAVVFVSHFLEQVYAISDRITVLRDGRVVGEYPTADIDRAELISKMLGQDFEELQALGSQRRAHQQDPEGDPVLVAEELGRDGEFEPTHLELFPGEIVALAGLRGSGRTELARLLTATDRAESGALLVAGEPVTRAGPGAGLRRRLVLSPENRHLGGVIESMSIADNIMLALQANRGWGRPVSGRERRETVEWYIEVLGIGDVTPDTLVGTLSGGAQQKVLLARWLATRPRVLVLDEPTKGIDIAAKLEIQKQIAHLADEGMAVVFISSELDEVVRMGDRIVVLKDRRKIGEMSNGPGVSVDTVVELIAADDETA
ncbi:sugar ABC transporter ATP-binding protein [Tessaracoccus terricola]